MPRLFVLVKRLNSSYLAVGTCVAGEMDLGYGERQINGKRQRVHVCAQRGIDGVFLRFLL